MFQSSMSCSWSDRNTKWAGHGWETFMGLSSWEHTQELSIFAIRPDGTGFRKVIGKEGYALGSPSWSADGKCIVYYEMTRETTWDAHSSFDVNSANSSIVSVDFATGTDRVVEVNTSGVKIYPQYLGNTSSIGYLLKGTTYYNTTARSPACWDANWTYRFTDVFPTINTAGRLAITQKQLGDSAVISLNATGTDNETVFDPVARGILSLSSVEQGTSGAFQSSWSSDGNWLTYGVGYWFAGRASNGGWIVCSKADGSEAMNLTTSAIPLSAGGNNTLNTGFPSFLPDGTKIVFRVWGADAEDGDTSQLGLRILHLDQVTANGTYPVTVLTNWWDTLPSFSPDGTKIVFTRRVSGSNYEVCTIAPDGSDLQVIMYSTGEYGFQSECALYDNTFQPYGQINIMDADGGNKRALTNSLWEDSMPAYVPGEFL
ncbi:WD40-like beta Propeller containing protein [Aspergillus oryzae]|uniref:WD40-like beta Propeller containing protein n=1 Tax=Aspergillus oryzae TaxID=5062 RepID=A0A1S9DBH5_ASPOZ|nr:WD40-like beta Propeller containing protein [Aspergillus oryzae]